jgi:hypothetical protein
MRVHSLQSRPRSPQSRPRQHLCQRLNYRNNLNSLSNRNNRNNPSHSSNRSNRQRLLCPLPWPIFRYSNRLWRRWRPRSWRQPWRNRPRCNVCSASVATAAYG